MAKHSELEGANTRDWGPWQLDKNACVLVAQSYEVDLHRCATSAQVLDWICQVACKRWANDGTIAGLVRAFKTVLNPQANLCPFGTDKTLSERRITELVAQTVAKSAT